jgi:arginase family enzyme
MEDLFLIDVQYNNNSIKNKVLNRVDYEVINEMYEKTDENKIPIVYNFMYRYINTLSSKVIVTYSSDPNISASTISGMNEKFIVREYLGENNILFKSDLRIIYITSISHLIPLDLSNNKNFYDSILSNLMYEKETFTKHGQVLLPEQIILVGLNDNLISESEKEILDKSEIIYFTLERIKKLTLKKVIDFIKRKFSNKPVHIVFDMGSVDDKIIPLKLINKSSSFNLDDIDIMFSEFSKLNVKSIDITNYVLNFDDKKLGFRVTCETLRRPLIKLFNLKTKKINIFDEDTKFLIWRPVIQLSEDDIGWFILRGVPDSQKEKILKEVNDTIQTITVDDDNGEPTDVLISSTTMNEQQSISYYMVDTIEDCALVPIEKVQMMFELLMKY